MPATCTFFFYGGGGGKRSNNAYLYKRRQDTADLPYEVLACFILVPKDSYSTQEMGEAGLSC